ncbi:hypothetical protein [Kribbella jejuensis]|uniref:hypothetical protein n=1 Tax=Kribbella jejuensis TaxID=236068 RepID=UPI00163A7670|nr:hypothetical protein [Kribbella jejuensis]
MPLSPLARSRFPLNPGSRSQLAITGTALSRRPISYLSLSLGRLTVSCLSAGLGRPAVTQLTRGRLTVNRATINRFTACLVAFRGPANSLVVRKRSTVSLGRRTVTQLTRGRLTVNRATISRLIAGLVACSCPDLNLVACSHLAISRGVSRSLIRRVLCRPTVCRLTSRVGYCATASSHRLLARHSGPISRPTLSLIRRASTTGDPRSRRLVRLGQANDDVAVLKREAIRRLVRLVHDADSWTGALLACVRRYGGSVTRRRTARALTNRVLRHVGVHGLRVCRAAGHFGGGAVAGCWSG